MEKINKVMLIDDSKAVNNMNESLLSSMGLFNEIQKFSTSNSAIEELMNVKKVDDFTLPNIIFLDINMPINNGFDFLEEYLKIKEVVKSNFEPMIVILTDHLDFENLTKSKVYKSYGVLDHLKKPMDKDDVLDLIEEHYDAFNI